MPPSDMSEQIFPLSDPHGIYVNLIKLSSPIVELSAGFSPDCAFYHVSDFYNPPAYRQHQQEPAFAIILCDFSEYAKP